MSLLEGKVLLVLGKNQIQAVLLEELLEEVLR